jgi:hypothetical protein
MAVIRSSPLRTAAARKKARLNPLAKPSQKRIALPKAPNKKAPVLSEKALSQPRDRYTPPVAISTASSDEKAPLLDVQFSEKPVTKNHAQKPKRWGVKKNVIVAIVLAGGFISNGIRAIGKQANHTRPNLSYGDLVNHFPQGDLGRISHDGLSKLLESSDPKTQSLGALLLGNPSLSSLDQPKNGLISLSQIKAGEQPFKGIPDTQPDGQKSLKGRRKSRN